MHEVGIMQSVVAMAVEAAQARGASRIHVLRMRIGVLSGVVKESLEFAFEVAREGTPAAGGTLEVETVPVTCWCETCQAEFAGDEDFLWCCPTCQRPSSQIRHGRELELASVEVS